MWRIKFVKDNISREEIVFIGVVFGCPTSLLAGVLFGSWLMLQLF